MYFKRLEIIGFKSFAEKTTINFEPGVTAIVGPNGCGKSNVSDAIRWVLGEQSAKSLRGASMEDVIFNGSSVKEPLSLAEVSLTFSNENRVLPIDYDEVTISRRLYRSGESEYLLNKNTVRLKDIHEMLLGTGIGTESYSVIEQGKMDVILNSKPEERREIFEEAAGITKFKSKKKEALRKLEQTDQNLLRINDIILEVKRQIGSIERQAKKAENYKIEFEKMKKLELVVASREFLIFEEKRKTQEEGLAGLKEKEAEYEASMREMNENCDAKRDRVQTFDETLREGQVREMQTAADIRRDQDRILLSRERLGELQARSEHMASDIETARRRLEEFAAEYDNLNAQFEAIGREESDGNAFLGGVEAEFAAIEAGARSAEEEAENLKQGLSDKGSAKLQIRNQIAKVQAEINALRNNLKKLRHEEEALLGEIREICETLNPPLFEGTATSEQPATVRFELKLRDFKARILDIIRSLLGRQAAEPGPEAEGQIDGEVRAFTEEIVKIHGQVAEWQSRAQHLEASRKKLEEKLSVISQEAQALLSEEEQLLAKERDLESQSVLLSEEETAIVLRISELEESVRQRGRDKEALLVRLAETRSQQSHRTERREKIEKDRAWILESKSNEEAQLANLERELGETASKRESLESESAFLEEEIGRLSMERDEALRQMESIKLERQTAQEELARLEEERSRRQKFLQEARDRVHAYELQHTEVRFEIDRLKERIFNAYQVDLLSEFSQFLSVETEAADYRLEDGALDVERAKTDILAQREKLQKMGPVNLVAIQEYDEMKERYEFLTKQHDDLVQAKDDLHKAIQKINRTTRELFVDTFAKIQKNFSEYYKLLFGGGSAELVLLDEQDVLESGIDIVARPPGKKLQSISLLSGGEKALTAVALLFSLFKVKPSPFCILDEIDAPLDETNVDRFCNVLKEFIVESQFILITHNKRTMNLADVMYGVTMEQTGISRIVSVRFHEHSKARSPQKAEEALVS